MEMMNQLRLESMEMMICANDTLKRLESPMTVDDDALLMKLPEVEDAGVKSYINNLPIPKTNFHPYQPDIKPNVNSPHLQGWITYIQFLIVSIPTNLPATIKETTSYRRQKILIQNLCQQIQALHHQIYTNNSTNSFSFGSSFMPTLNAKLHPLLSKSLENTIYIDDLLHVLGTINVESLM
mmetsp:Transcript_54596/g.65834  ORF Transcript_54596/g.65834 Transcript_54596/m.65834 type:complete len:181 (-) Transcript_54596:200-742(-)